MPTQNRPTRDGFSLIEILIVVAIMATLMGLLLPALQKVRLAARRLESKNNLRQIATATHLWHDTNSMLPRTCGWNNQNNVPAQYGVNGTPFFAILPFMGQEASYLPSLGPLYSQSGLRFDPTDPVKYKVFEDNIENNCVQCVGVVAYRANWLATANPPPQTPKQFLSVLDASKSDLTTATSYLANKDLLDQGYSINQIPDGSSQTMMYAEGVKTCDGGDSVYDNLNAFDPAPFRYRVMRTNNWAVGSEAVILNYSSRAYVIKSKVKVVDFTKSDYSATSPVLTQYSLDGQFASTFIYIGNSSNINISSALFNDYNNLDRYDQFCAKGNIPAFFKGSLESPSMQLQYVFSNGAWTRNGVPAVERNVTFQPVGTVVNQLNCVWFAPQAFSGGLNVVMADASVHTIDPSVSQASWDAALSPKGNDFVGPDFFE